MGRLRRGTVALASVVGLTGTALAMSVPPTAGSEAPDPAPFNTTDLPVSASPPSPLGDLEQGSYQITLVTGDTVTVNRVGPSGGPDGGYTVETEPATRPDGSLPRIQVTNLGESDSLYAVPDDAWDRIDAGLLDRQLFNVAYLAENGYADRADLPLIVEYAGDHNARTLARRAAELAEASREVPLDSIDATAIAVDRAGAADFWSSLTSGRGAARLATGIERVWLDPVVSASLDQSVPQIGTPDAWEAGLDGTGITVAVLDTGIDAAHPDVEDRIVASRSFIPGQEVADGHGHGTHVASTVAGSGAASAGRYTGVAPGADLVVGKVLSDAGSSVGSSVIAGMEWAAVERDADVVSMSLGGVPTDGTDPLSQAVNELTEQTDALFVIAAGNAGRDYAVGTPGAADAALTVGAVNRNDQLASFSSRGPRREDYAIKPEITAPGVSIGAARAEGTSMSGAVHIDENYTRVSGTSMATPHVAGAAAILAQQHPDWTSSQLKAALVGTAQDGGYTVYQQGSGRVDVSRAVEQEIQVSPATADFGFLRLPAEGQPVTKTLTYTNPTDEPVTLELAATARTEDGAAAPGGALSLDHDTLEVPAGGSATATVSFDQNAVEPDLYTGSVVATADEPDVRLTTPVGIVIGAQLHSVTVRQLHSGDPKGWHPSSVTLAPVDGPAERTTRGGWHTRGAGIDVQTPEAWEEGLEFLVPEGTYFAFTSTLAQWYDATGGGSHQATLLDVEVDVPGETEIVLDAAEAEKVTFDTPRPTEGFQRRFMMQRWVPDHVAAGGGFVTLGENPTDTNGREDYWVTPTEEARTGEFRLVAEHTLVAPALTMQVEGNDGVDLHPQYPGWGSPFATAVPPGISVAEPAVNGEPAATAPGPVVRTGDEVALSVRVTNPAGAPTWAGLHATTPFGEADCAATTLPPREETTCTVRGTAAAGPQVAPITVTGTAVSGRPWPTAGAVVAHYTGAEDPTNPPPPSGAGVEISAGTVSGHSAERAPGPEVEAGTDLIIEVTATNDGTVALEDVSATSDVGELTCLRAALAPDERTTCTLRSSAAEGKHAVAVTVTGRDQQGSLGGAATVVYYTGRPKPAVFSGHQVLDVVDAGHGTPAELAGLDLQDALVLLRADPAQFDGGKPTCWPSRAAVDAVVAAGAAGVVLAPNEEHLFFDRPGNSLDGSLLCRVSPRLDSFEAASIEDAVTQVPIAYLPFDQAAALREPAADGELRIAVDGTAETPYFYQLRPAMNGSVPESLHFTVGADELATIDHEIHADTAAAFGLTLTAWRPNDASAGPRLLGTRALPPFATTAPWEVTEYYWPLDADTVVRHEMEDFTSPAGRQVRYDVLDRPTHTTMVWNDGPPVPAPVPPLAGTAPPGYQTHGSTPIEMASCTGCREGDIFWPHLRYTASSDPDQIGWDVVGQLGQLARDPDTRLYRDGAEIPSSPDPLAATLLSFELPPEPAEYRLTHRLGSTETAWDFSSEAVSDEQTPEAYTCNLDWLERVLKLPPSNTPCRPEPLIFLRYDLGLDLSNRAPAPGPQTFQVTTDRQPSLQPMPDIAGLKVWVSYDEGTEWTKARVRPRGDGRFEATVVHRPAHRRASDSVSIRAEAWDKAGNRVEQTIRNAYQLADRSGADD